MSAIRDSILFALRLAKVTLVGAASSLSLEFAATREIQEEWFLLDDV